MLVITRKFGEAVMIGNAKVTVLRKKGGGIVLGIDADRSVPVVRSELLEKGVRLDSEGSGQPLNHVNGG